MTDRVSSELFEMANAWAEADPDPLTADLLRAWLNEKDERAVHECFAPIMEFGTAGLRGIVGPGPARMNLAVIRRVSRALADQIAASHGARGKVIVGGDARLDTGRFSREAAGVLAAAGCSVMKFELPVATPVVAFASLRERAAAGVVVTASHNPPEYNGYKVYGPDAIQIVPPTDAQIARRMRQLPAAKTIPNDGECQMLGRDYFSKYQSAILEQRPWAVSCPLRIAYTPLHGVGWQHAGELLKAAGYHDVHPVPSQVVPDGRFPTVNFPNPEEPGTLALGMKFASEVQAHVLIANDPDADRLAIALPDEAGVWHAVSGNQLGIILTDYLLGDLSRQGQRGLVVSTVVSTPMIEAVARSYDARVERTLTGFKWLWTAALNLLKDESLHFAIAWEEALGYSTHTAVRDKDGIAAALVACDWASACLESGQLPYHRLGALYREHGAWASRQVNIVRTGAEGTQALSAAFERLCNEPPARLGELRVTQIEDYRVAAADRPFWRGTAELVIVTLTDGSRLLARPSGTEPKLKIYLDVPDAATGSQDPFAALRLAEIRADAIGRALLEWLHA